MLLNIHTLLYSVDFFFQFSITLYNLDWIIAYKCTLLVVILLAFCSVARTCCTCTYFYHQCACNRPCSPPFCVSAPFAKFYFYTIQFNSRARWTYEQMSTSTLQVPTMIAVILLNTRENNNNSGASFYGVVVFCSNCQFDSAPAYLCNKSFRLAAEASCHALLGIALRFHCNANLRILQRQACNVAERSYAQLE